MQHTFIDSHHHLWNPQTKQPDIGYVWLNNIGQPKPFGDPTKIQRDYLLEEYLQDSNSAESFTCGASVHVQSDGAIANPVAETAWIQQLNDEHQHTMVCVGFADLRHRDIETTLQQHHSYSCFRGVRQIVGYLPSLPNLSFADEELVKNQTWRYHFGKLKEYQLSFDCQLYPEQMPAYADFFANHPTVPIIIDHAGCPYQQNLAGIKLWQKSLERLAELPQMYIKISGLGMYKSDWNATSFKDWFDTIHALFSSQRIMFGSNFPVDKLYYNYAELLNKYQQLCTNLPAEQQQNIFKNTAQEIYRIPRTRIAKKPN